MTLEKINLRMKEKALKPTTRVRSEPALARARGSALETQ